MFCPFSHLKTNLDILHREINKIFTCVSVSLNELENSALSAILRYCLSLNFFSKAMSCCVVKGVRGFRFGLCFRSAHLTTGGPPGFEFGFDMLAVRNWFHLYSDTSRFSIINGRL